MTCHDTQDKVLKVIDSCETPDQLEVAKRYAQIWINRLLEAAIDNAFLAEYAFEVQQKLKTKQVR